MTARIQMDEDEDCRQDPDDLNEADWRQLYERYDGCIAAVARRTGLTESVVRWRLTKFDIHEIENDPSWEISKMLPQDIGLSPLNCGRCGKEEIYEHPCPDCDYDPRDGDA